MEHASIPLFSWFQQFQVVEILTTILVLFLIDIVSSIHLSANFTLTLVRVTIWTISIMPFGELLRRYAAKIPELPSEYSLIIASLMIFGTSTYISAIRQLREITIRRRLKLGKFKQYGVLPFSAFDTGESDYGEGIIRLSPDIMTALGIHRHSLVGIRGTKGITLYRIVRGTPPRTNDSDDQLNETTPERDYSNTIGLELDDRQPLNARNKTASLKIWKAGPINHLAFLLNHTNILTRLNFGVSLLVALLGILAGIAIAVFSESLSKIAS